MIPEEFQFPEMAKLQILIWQMMGLKKKSCELRTVF